MSFSSKEIVGIAGDLLIEDRIGKDCVYDWIDIVGINQRPADLKRSLYFTTHSDGADGWHNAFDRRQISAGVARDRGWHLATEPGVDSGNYEHIIVSSLVGLAEKLYQFSRLNSKPLVIGVTGSIGKTTTVAFLEHLIRESGAEVVRFWSKRLTPLLVQCHYINRVTNAVPFVVMEYSAYGKDHVSELARILPPDIAFLTNVYEMHVGNDLFEDEHDVFRSKVKIKPNGAVGMINNFTLEKLGLLVPNGWNGFDVDDDLEANNPLLPPTQRTAELYTVGRILADTIGIPFDNFIRAFATFIPQERRIISCNYGGYQVFFDGEATGASRLLSWFETIKNVKPPLLLVDKANSMLASRELLVKVFESDQTFVLDTPENREHIPVNAKFVNDEKFGELLKQGKDGFLVYHKGLSTRQLSFNPEQYLRDRWGE